MKKKMKKLLAFTAAAVLLVTTAGCGNSTSAKTDSTGESSGSKKGVTILVASSTGWVKDIDKELAKKYEAESGNKIQWQLSPDDQYSNVLNSKFAVGEGPDVYYSQSGAGVLEYQPDKRALDLSNEEWVSRYRDWAKDGTTYDGKIIQCLTWSVDGWGILYNPEIFEKAGIKEVPKTFEEWKAACEAIQKIGITPIYEGGSTQWHQAMWLDALSAQAESSRPGLRDQLNTGEVKIADLSEFKTGLTQLKELMDAGYMGKDYMSNKWEDHIQAMGTGKYAMTLTATTAYSEILNAYPDSKADQWGMFPCPLNDNTIFSQSSGGIGRTVNKDSKVIDAVKDYFNFLTRPENLQAYYDACPYLGQCAFTDIDGNISNCYKSVEKNSTAIGRNFETGIAKWNSTEIGTLMQNFYLGGTEDEVLQGIDTLRETIFEK